MLSLPVTSSAQPVRAVINKNRDNSVAIIIIYYDNKEPMIISLFYFIKINM